MNARVKSIKSIQNVNKLSKILFTCCLLASCTHLGFLKYQDQFQVVAYTPQDRTQERLCSGIIIKPSWILTAAHCVVQGEQYKVVSFNEVKTENLSIAASVYSTKIDMDIALLHMTSYEESAIKPPSSLKSASIAVPQKGDQVFMMGYGLRNDLGIGSLTRINGTISKVKSNAVIFQSETKVGPCVGDSGAPIFSSIPNKGPAHFLGVLVAGSESCSGPDKFVPAHAIMRWVKEEIGKKS